jgi:predicted 2-oxoglutarate/Fe(II)-dependent dioxygenase YbiX
MTGDYKMRIPDKGRNDRIDHWVMNEETSNFIAGRLQARLTPEIQKAFQYRITRFERFRIGCYEGERGGEAHGHRDNTLPLVAHRRFAVSINLNSEQFEGGELRFPEYGGHLYRPETGAAIAFSSSILHEPLHVTSGRRYVLLAFLFGEH